MSLFNVGNIKANRLSYILLILAISGFGTLILFIKSNQNREINPIPIISDDAHQENLKALNLNALKKKSTTTSNLQSNKISIYNTPQIESEFSSITLNLNIEQEPLLIINTLSQFQSLYDNLNINSTAKEYRRIAEILALCKKQPLSAIDLEDKQHQLSQKYLMLGIDEVVTEKSLKQLTFIFDDCKKISDIISLEQETELLAQAIDLGDTTAMVKLATQQPKNSKLTNHTNEKENNQKSIKGALLYKARAECDYAALSILAHPNQNGFKTSWTYPNEGEHSEEFLAFANLIALNHLITARLNKGNTLLNHISKTVDLRQYNLSPFEISQAKQYGKTIYQQNCF